MRMPTSASPAIRPEASKVAGQMLNICIRALDYCPPVDIMFGEYLRALITADFDLVPNDRLGYRIAFIEAFRKRTGVAGVLNTSFNIKDEPIVCTPRDALRCFYGSGMDALIIGDFIVEKAR